VLVAFALVPSSMGFVFGPVTALALRDVRQAAGTALALMGALQFVLAGVAAFVVGLAGATATAPLVWSLAVLALISAAVLILVSKHQR